MSSPRTTVAVSGRRWFLLTRSSSILGLLLASFVPVLSGAAESQPERDQPDAERIRYWVSQLGSQDYLRREKASRWLREAGPAAVPAVVERLDRGDLEVTRRAIDLLQKIALDQSPFDDGGAWGALNMVAQAGAGSQASRATFAIDEIRDQRGEMAREVLASAGVFVGTADFIVQASITQKNIVEIDDRWDGDVEKLRWLRWVDDVRHARLIGEAIDPRVIASLRRMKDLDTIALVDGTMDSSVIDALDGVSPMKSLEIRYVPVDTEMSNRIAALQIRESLSLMGTGVPADVVDRMRKSLPSLDIEFRQGGFLGVKCRTPQIASIAEVVPGSAADRAGLLPNDIIVGIDDTEVERFQDLQEAINRHPPGEKIELRYTRGGKIGETTVELGRLEQERVRRLPNR